MQLIHVSLSIDGFYKDFSQAMLALEGENGNNPVEEGGYHHPARDFINVTSKYACIGKFIGIC